MAYLSDIFSQLNIMIQSLQGPNIMLVDVSEKLLSFREKFRLWNRTIESQKIASIPVFNQFLEDTEVCFDDVQLVINKHLASLKNFITRI